MNVHITKNFYFSGKQFVRGPQRTKFRLCYGMQIYIYGALIGGVVETFGQFEDMDLKLKPGIEEYEFRGSPASTLCLTLLRARR